MQYQKAFYDNLKNNCPEHIISPRYGSPFVLSFLCLIFLLSCFSAKAQINSDSLNNKLSDSLVYDSIQLSLPGHQSALEDQVQYEAEDSIILNLQEKKAYLYGNAWIIFQDIKLQADYIIVDFENKDLFAKGIVDTSNGKYIGRPAFTDQGKVYEADTMKYNFETKKGFSVGVLTTEKDGFIHGEKVLRDSNENIYVKNARFTTCNLPDPHFYIRAGKIKVIPKKQIVTGPANLVVSKISTPLIVPFGFFPIPEKKSHGILFPSFGESRELGHFFRDLGYYFPINDYMDLQVMSNFYFRGSWGASINSNYYKRYKYRGNLGMSYNKIMTGEPETPSFNVSNDVKINWQYSRDAKAKPGSSFGASVNFVTSSYLKNNTSNYSDIISTTSNSSINYSKSAFKNKLNLTLNSNIYQDLSKKDINLSLPQFTANLSRQMLFTNANIQNKTLKSFVRNLGFSYAGSFRNQVQVKEETLFKHTVLDSFNNGISHNIPLTTSFKALKWITVSPNFQYNEYWYFKTTEKRWDENQDSLITNHAVNGFERGHNYRTSIGFSTIIYGMKQFKSGQLKAIRHVVRPNISAVWNPDFSKGEKYGYRAVQTDTLGNFSEYSIFEQGIMGRPGGGPQGSLNFGFGNNLEIKILSKKDTSNGGIKKLKLIESFNINSGYNFLADSLNLVNIGMNGNTTLFNRIRINYRSTLDPYYYDSTGSREYKVNRFLWDESGKLARFTSSAVSISTNLNPQAFAKKENSNVNQDDLEFINNNLGNYIDFNIPWSLTINYNISSNSSFYGDKIVNQTFTFNGDLSLTPSWKIGASSGYDISKKELVLTSLEFYRDLHCWEFSFQWYPIIRQQFEFSLRVKPGTLQDLKLNRRRSWWDF